MNHASEITLFPFNGYSFPDKIADFAIFIGSPRLRIFSGANTLRFPVDLWHYNLANG
jgi:hypothetical protein